MAEPLALDGSIIVTLEGYGPAPDEEDVVLDPMDWERL